jgi:hypothetical protein
MKKSILNSLNFFNTNDRFFHDKVVPSFEAKRFYNDYKNRLASKLYFKWQFSSIAIEYIYCSDSLHSKILFKVSKSNETMYRFKAYSVVL